MHENSLKPDFFEFFIELSANNRKGWFDENRTRYEQDVKKPFEILVVDLLGAFARHQKKEITVRSGDCIFRINRDIRFSKDKTPYKLNRSAVISPEGKKSLGPDGFYFEAGPEQCAFYAGFYMPDKDQLMQIRRHIAGNPETWEKIKAEKAFKSTFGEILGSTQKRIPAEFTSVKNLPKEVYNTQFYIQHLMEPEVFIEQDPVKVLMNLWNTAQKLTKFLSDSTRVQD
ncbi:MAG: DUF2461 domain-containing protein [Sphingomonadales bacterium]|nr:DUF2461 domain-containing protein [Sphingomonadales bacterium]